MSFQFHNWFPLQIALILAVNKELPIVGCDIISTNNLKIVNHSTLLTFTDTFCDTPLKEPFLYAAKTPSVRFALKEASLTLSLRGTLITKRTKIPGGITVTELVVRCSVLDGLSGEGDATSLVVTRETSMGEEGIWDEAFVDTFIDSVVVLAVVDDVTSAVNVRFCDVSRLDVCVNTPTLRSEADSSIVVEILIGPEALLDEIISDEGVADTFTGTPIVKLRLGDVITLKVFESNVVCREPVGTKEVFACCVELKVALTELVVLNEYTDEVCNIENKDELAERNTM